MDEQIQKLKCLVGNFLHTSREDILKTWGNPLQHSDNDVWFYNKYRLGVFKDEITFIFEEDIVTDIMIAQYIFWKEYQNIFYYEGEDNEYKVMKF